MIQRIQTLYLLLADLLIASLFFFPIAEFIGKDKNMYWLYLSGLKSTDSLEVEKTQEFWLVLLLSSVILLMINLIIFQYRNRKRQLIFSNLTVMLLLGLTSMMYFDIWKIRGLLGGSYSMQPTFTFPLIAMILIYLAMRGIKKDEDLVKSIDRIR